MRFLASLALAQLRRQRGQWTLLGAGVALVVAIPVATAGLSRAVDAQTVRRTISQLDLADRTLLVSQEATSAARRGTAAQADAQVRAQLARLTAGRVVRELLFRPLVVAGSSIELGGADRLASSVRLISGRLPRTCTPTRCEVVAFGADPVSERRAAATLGVVVTGTAQRSTSLLADGELAPVATSLLLADGADAIGRLASLELFSRHLAWAALTDADRVVALGVPAYLRRSSDVDAALSARVGGTTFESPSDALAQAAGRADVSARRLQLLGGFAAVLLLGFALVAALNLRRQALLLASVLRRRGAAGRQVAGLSLAEATVGCLAGASAGAALGAALSAAQAAGTGLSGPAVAGQALEAAAWPAGALTAATVAVTAAVLLWPATAGRRLWRSLDLITLACLAATVLAGARGSTSAGGLAAGADPLVFALPVLSCVVAGLLGARAWAPAIRLVERLLPARSIAGRMGLLGALRRPLTSVATTGYLAAAVTSVVFAGAYRSTLLANDADRAAFEVPLDATLATSIAQPIPQVTPGQFGPDVRSYGVVRTSASVTRLAGVVDSVPLVAPDASALAQLHRWARTSGSREPAAELAGDLRLPVPPAPALPASATTLAIDQRGAGPQTALTVWLRAPDGRQVNVALHVAGGELVGRVPRSGEGAWRLTAFGVDQSASYATHHAHQLGEGNTDVPQLSGTLVLGAVRVDGSPLPWSWSGWGSQQGSATATPQELRLVYRIGSAAMIAVPHYEALHALVLPVAVDARTAQDAHGGIVVLSLDSSTVLSARVVTTFPRLPTTGSTFILADRESLSAVQSLTEPGGNATEFWLAGSSPRLARELAASRATVTRRREVAEQLDTDPVGRGARTLLLLVALLAIAVGAVALLLFVLGERRDGAGELYAWEADGTAPRTLRRALVVREIAVAAVAIPVGALAGLIVASAGTTLVAVDASGSLPTPPLQVTLGSALTVLALTTGVGAGLLAGWVVAARSLREPFPRPAEADLR